MSRKPVFVLKNGDLSKYSLICGYVQAENNCEDISKRHKYWEGCSAIALDKEAGCELYNVRVRNNSELSTEWRTHDNLKDARKDFNKTCRKILKGK